MDTHSAVPAFPRSSPAYRKPKLVTGSNLVFRDACAHDAEFILGLRTDEKKSRYLSSTSAAIGKQVEWLERYAHDASQIYFIIEDEHRQSVGTVRLYDAQGDSFCWGSWIKKDGAPPGFAIESALMVYHFARYLGFQSAHFEVRKENIAVCRFHERLGAVIASQSAQDVHYTMDSETIRKALDRFGKFLPAGIAVVM
jgi:RimJ/RimL family protein N-acetyltransferase